jgi:dTMP kinase
MGAETQELLCVIEGLDGTGTTTVSRLVAEALQARDLRVCLTAEPTNGPFGTLLRRHLAGTVTLPPHAATLAFCADRADHLASHVRPSLGRGDWVISDRYLLSTLAYQGAEGVDKASILASSATFEIPGLTVVLEAPDEVRVERMAERTGRERYEDPSLAPDLRSSYQESIELLRTHGWRIEVLDATLDASRVAAAVLSLLET